MEASERLSRLVKAEALRLGFDACGVARAEAVDPSAMQRLDRWLAQGCQAGMDYIRRGRDLRADPRQLVEGVKSIVCVALGYYPERTLPPDAPQLSYYAYGRDYHEEMRERLNRLLASLRTLVGPVQGRVFCDTAPILERYWAVQAGLGWIGKNTQLILPRLGSYFFLGELFLDLELAPDVPLPSRCGRCTRCLEACPGQALHLLQGLDARRCLSYLTIEHRGPFPEGIRPPLGNRIYGCDACQQACPWNRFARPHQVEAFRPSEALLAMGVAQWRRLTREEYTLLFRGSAVKRAKYEGLMRNIRAALGEDV